MEETTPVDGQRPSRLPDLTELQAEALELLHKSRHDFVSDPVGALAAVTGRPHKALENVIRQLASRNLVEVLTYHPEPTSIRVIR